MSNYSRIIYPGLILFNTLMMMVGGDVHAQDFGTVGTTWHYTLPNFSNPSIDYVQVQSIGDTTINGQACHHLQVLHGYDCSTTDGNAFVYEQNGIVYYFVSQMNKFSELYNFNVTPGNAYKVYVNGISGQPDSVLFRITGVFNDTINGNILKKRTLLRLTGSYSFSTTILDTFLERIGGPYLFPQYILCEAAPNQLRCFQDSLLGFYSTNAAPFCDYISTGINESNTISSFEFFPNPADEAVTISNPLTGNLDDQEITITDLSGKIFSTMKTSGSKFQISTKNFPNGIYFMTVGNNKNSTMGKLIIQHK